MLAPITTVDVTGTVTVPDLVGSAVDTALARIAEAGLAVTVAAGRIDTRAGLDVAAQSPPAGTVVRAGSVVTLEVVEGGLRTPFTIEGCEDRPAGDSVGLPLASGVAWVEQSWQAILPGLPPTLGLRNLADAYVIAGQRATDACSATFDMALRADLPRAPEPTTG